MLSTSIGGVLYLTLIIAFVAAVVVLTFLLVGTVAQNKGREPISWIILSLFISPLGALILLWLLPPLDGFGRGPPRSPA